jgi:hypothetical protein
MSTWKKLTVVLVLLICASLIATTQYVRLSVSFIFKIETRGARVQFIAADTSPAVPETYLLDDTDDDGIYELDLGTWKIKTNKSFPCAFAIVNTELFPIRIYRVKVTGSGIEYLKVYLHKNKDTPCDQELIYKGGITYETIGTDPHAYESGDTALLYWNGTRAGYPYSIDYSTTGWVLAAATTGGYVDTTTLYYDDNTATAALNSASYNNIKNVWVYEQPATTSNDANGLTNDGTSTANFVWVEIDIFYPEEAISASGTIYFYFMSL